MVFLCYRSSPPNMVRTISKTIKNITRQERDTEIAENGTEGGDGTTEDVWRRVSSPGQKTAWWKAGREVWDSQAPSETWRSPSDRLDLKMLEGRVLARDLKEPRAGSYYLVVKAQKFGLYPAGDEEVSENWEAGVGDDRLCILKTSLAWSLEPGLQGHWEMCWEITVVT